MLLYMYTDGLSIAPEFLRDLYYCKRVILAFVCEACQRPQTRKDMRKALLRSVSSFIVSWQLVIAASCLARSPPMTQYTVSYTVDIPPWSRTSFPSAWCVLLLF
jgi:hypothetical protein